MGSRLKASLECVAGWVLTADVLIIVPDCLKDSGFDRKPFEE